MRLLLLAAICFIVPLAANAQTTAKVLTNGSREQKKIALTFDACPAHDAKVDWGVINTLIETGTPATLFLSGKWMEEFPNDTQRLATFPQFELANHSYSHPHMPRLTPERMTDELQKTQEILQRLAGVTATHFRPPYGEYNDQVVESARALGLETVEFDLPSGDPSPSFTKAKLLAHVTHLTQNGSIVVMHMNGRGWHTAEALPEIIAGLRDKGFQLVTVNELAGESKPTEQGRGYPYFLKQLLDKTYSK